VVDTTGIFTSLGKPQYLLTARTMRTLCIS
jgi:hypothetical protein